MRFYEGLFLVDPTLAAQDWNNVVKHIQSLISKYKGEIIHLSKWGDRKLSYEIKKLQRGIYILVYFKCPPDKVKFIKKDSILSNIIARCLLLKLLKEPPLSNESVKSDLNSSSQQIPHQPTTT